MPFYKPAKGEEWDETAQKAVDLANKEQEQVAIIWGDDDVIVNLNDDPTRVLAELDASLESQLLKDKNAQIQEEQP